MVSVIAMSSPSARVAHTILFAAALLALLAAGPADVAANALFLRTDSRGPRNARDIDADNDVDDAPTTTPTMSSWHVTTHVLHRYAKTSLETRLRNPSAQAREIEFSAVLPQAAFISAFHMEIEGKVYHAYVKEKEEAQRDYNTARGHGQSTAIVVKARDSNVFTASVNVEAMSKVTFNLTYEELLSRRLGLYHHVINIDPQQIVPDMSIRVRIEETHALQNLTVPPLRVSNEIDATDGVGADDASGPTSIARPAPNVAEITWSPSTEEQRDLRSDGVRGQLVVQYDVNRDNNPANILMGDGYFVHFYAPADLATLRKHAVFVVDTSGSMDGAKLPQLKQAMGAVLSDLQPGDAFSIVVFESNVKIWRPQGGTFSMPRYHAEVSLPEETVVNVTSESVAQAKAFVDSLDPFGGTNIHDALMTALDVVKLGRRVLRAHKLGENPEPLIFFLTDGEANEGAFTRPDDIVRVVTARNKRKTPVFCLAFGRGADLPFLKSLALENAAFARLIYEAGDAALQLREFYRQVASPLLANVTFNYEPSQVSNASLTRLHFNTLFAGGELVVAGKMEDGAAHERLRGVIMAKSTAGRSRFGLPTPISIRPSEAPPLDQSASFMERLWAHLTVQQLLQDEERAHNALRNSTGRARALDLALKYSFVTSLTSLVVVKPNATTAADPVDVDAVPEPAVQYRQTRPISYGAQQLSIGGGYPSSGSSYSGYSGSGSSGYPALAMVGPRNHGLSGPRGSSGSNLPGPFSFPIAAMRKPYHAPVRVSDTFQPGRMGLPEPALLPGGSPGSWPSSGTAIQGPSQPIHVPGHAGYSFMEEGSSIPPPRSNDRISGSSVDDIRDEMTVYDDNDDQQDIVQQLGPRTTSPDPPTSTSERPSALTVVISEGPSRTADLGSTVRFSCRAQSTNPQASEVSIQWSKIGDALPAHAVDDGQGLLVISGVRATDVGAYMCLATDGGNIATKSSFLVVKATASIPLASIPLASTAGSSAGLTVADLSWAVDVKNDTHVFVTDQVYGLTRTLAYRIGAEQADVESGVCPSYGPGVSVCRHLPHCVLPEFKDDFSNYVTAFFCSVSAPAPDGNMAWFAGVCCPLTHQSASGLNATDQSQPGYLQTVQSQPTYAQNHQSQPSYAQNHQSQAIYPQTYQSQPSYAQTHQSQASYPQTHQSQASYAQTHQSQPSYAQTYQSQPSNL